jgi:hypothetical protein
MQNGDNIISILKDLDDLFDVTSKQSNEGERSSGVKAVLITLGPSFNSPREQYLIRFHCSDNDDDQSLPPLHVQHRLEQEISRRATREIIKGTLQDEYSNMFELPTARGAGCQSAMKVNIAFLLSKSAAKALFEKSESDLLAPNENVEHLKPEFRNNAGDANDQFLTPSLSYLMQRNFSIRTPRMRSKRRAIHRPFVVLDVVPCIKPSHQNESEDIHGFLISDSDIWLSLRRPLKGFKCD